MPKNTITLNNLIFLFEYNTYGYYKYKNTAGNFLHYRKPINGVRYKHTRIAKVFFEDIEKAYKIHKDNTNPLKPKYKDFEDKRIIYMKKDELQYFLKMFSKENKQFKKHGKKKKEKNAAYNRLQNEIVISKNEEIDNLKLENRKLITKKNIDDTLSKSDNLNTIHKARIDKLVKEYNNKIADLNKKLTSAIDKHEWNNLNVTGEYVFVKAKSKTYSGTVIKETFMHITVQTGSNDMIYKYIINKSEILGMKIFHKNECVEDIKYNS